MIKVGDKVKGFRFSSTVDYTEGPAGWKISGKLKYDERMTPYIGVEGEVIRVDENIFVIRFDINTNNIGVISWRYPIAEYLELQREEKLKELGL